MQTLNNSDFENGLDFITQHCGFPTFDEFKKNPDNWRRGYDDLFKSADESSVVFRKNIKETKYMWKDQFECSSIEQVERIARDEGFVPNDLEMCPKKTAISGMNENAGVSVIIQFWPKGEFRKRGGKVFHEA
jgi:hypothetical protein